MSVLGSMPFLDLEVARVQLSLRVGFGYGEDSGAFEQALSPQPFVLLPPRYCCHAWKQVIL